MFIRENSDHSRFRGKVNLKGPLGLQWLNLWEVWAVKVAGFFGSNEQREPNPYDIPLNPDWFIGIIMLAYERIPI